MQAKVDVDHVTSIVIDPSNPAILYAGGWPIGNRCGREIKPDNPRGVRAGEKQLERYKTEMRRQPANRTLLS